MTNAEYDQATPDAIYCDVPGYSTLRPFANLAVILLCVRFVCEFLLAIANIFITQKGMEDNFMLLLSSLGIISLFVLFAIACIVTISMWIYRAAKNKAYFGYSGQMKVYGADDKYKKNSSPGWSVGSFFVPVIMFFQPYISMKEIWFASNDSEYNDPRFSILFIKWWWTLFIVEGVDGWISFKLNLSGIETGLFDFITTIVLSAPLTLATIFLIKKITELQEKRVLEKQASCESEGCF